MYYINRILLIFSIFLYSFALTANEKIAYLNVDKTRKSDQAQLF